MGACVRTCKSCQNKFEPKYNTIQPTCSIQCAIDYANDKKLKERRKDTRKRKQVLLDQDRGYQIKKAQESFNAYIRERDKGEPCISCNSTKEQLNISSPISMVCGHFLSVGAFPELRFNPLNAHLQCTRCNGGAGKYGQFNSKAKTVTQAYNHRLILKIGQDKVDWLKGPHKQQKLSIEDIQEIKAYYKEQLKYLKSV